SPDLSNLLQWELLAATCGTLSPVAGAGDRAILRCRASCVRRKFFEFLPRPEVGAEGQLGIEFMDVIGRDGSGVVAPALPDIGQDLCQGNWREDGAIAGHDTTLFFPPAAGAAVTPSRVRATSRFGAPKTQ